MASARHAGGRNVSHQGSIAAIGEALGRFPEVSVEIDGHRTHAELLIKQKPRVEHAPVGAATRRLPESSPIETLPHRADEAALSLEDRRQSRWRSLDNHRWSADRQKE